MRFAPLSVFLLSLAWAPGSFGQCLPFPQALVPFATIAYITAPLANGDRLVVGALPPNGLSWISTGITGCITSAPKSSVSAWITGRWFWVRSSRRKTGPPSPCDGITR
jgi:hypothetical protein